MAALAIPIEVQEQSLSIRDRDTTNVFDEQTVGCQLEKQTAFA